MQIMRQHVDLLALRAAVLDRLPAGEAEEGALAAATGALMRRVRARHLPRRDGGEEQTVGATPATDATLARAAKLAGDAPVGSHHLLLAALADPDSAAARTLVGLGVDLDQARESLLTADVTGTSDEPPQEACAARCFQVAGETLTVVIVDPVLVKAGQAALDAVNANARPGGEGPASGTGETDAVDAGDSATTTVIRGDHPAAASLAAVWLELRKSLDKIADGASPSASAAGYGPALTQGRATAVPLASGPQNGSAIGKSLMGIAPKMRDSGHGDRIAGGATRGRTECGRVRRRPRAGAAAIPGRA